MQLHHGISESVRAAQQPKLQVLKPRSIPLALTKIPTARGKIAFPN